MGDLLKISTNTIHLFLLDKAIIQFIVKILSVEMVSTDDIQKQYNNLLGRLIEGLNSKRET
jgi:hypothetical protein